MKELVEIASVIGAIRIIYDTIYAISDFLTKILIGN